MSKFTEQFDENVKQIAAETAQGKAFEMVLVPAHQYDDVVKAGDKGDMRARQIIMTLVEWFKMADAAVEDGKPPRCCSCGDEMQKGEVCGWVLFLPIEETRESMGMVGPFCIDCMERGTKFITDNTVAHLREHGEVFSAQ